MKNWRVEVYEREEPYNLLWTGTHLSSLSHVRDAVNDILSANLCGIVLTLRDVQILSSKKARTLRPKSVELSKWIKIYKN
jgi:hypothetical protein